MKVIRSTGTSDIATVYIAEFENGKIIEFVESVQPPISKSEKWVIIISTLYGCPVKCAMCDAGNFYQGKLSTNEILSQIDYLVQKEFGGDKVPVDNFKIQFARMGEPAFNMNVLDALEELPSRYDAPGLLPSISSIAPVGSNKFFERLIEIKNTHYKNRFQLQFSIHTTDEILRDKIIPVNKWNFEKIAKYGKRFHLPGEQKIGLNFALEKNSPLDPDILQQHFTPDVFIIKITPVNPTYQAAKNNLKSFITADVNSENIKLKERLQNAGYDVIINIGELEENKIGSNCGQYVARYLEAERNIKNGYDVKLIRKNR